MGAVLARLVAGDPPDRVESARIECKEDPSVRGAHGERGPTTAQSNKTANLLTDAAAAMANADGGAILLGVSDKESVAVCFPGTAVIPS